MTEQAANGVGQGPRLLAIRYHLIFDDLLKLFEAEGFVVEVWDAADVSLEHFKECCGHRRPSVLFALNYSPELALLSSLFGIPYVTWTIDPLPIHRLRVREGTRPELSLAFVHREDTRRRLQALGISDVRTLHLAAPVNRRSLVTEPEALEPYRCPISFVGNSLAEDARELSAVLNRLGVGQPALREMKCTLDELFLLRGEDRRYQGEKGLESLWDRAELAPDASERDWAELLDAVNGYLSERLRHKRVDVLAEQGIEVWGDSGWEKSRACFRGPAGHGDELTTIYSASVINLDIPRLYQRDIMTMRVFDVLACRGVLLAEASSVLDACFVPGEHLFTYRNSDELVQQAEQILANPEYAQEVAQAGQERVRTAHRMEDRFMEILAACREKGWLTS